jgi:hypothetical protein
MFCFGSKSEPKAGLFKSSSAPSHFSTSTLPFLSKQAPKNPFVQNSALASSLIKRNPVGFSKPSVVNVQKATCDYSYPEISEVSLPFRVKGSYDKDFEIIKVHEAIRDVFSYYRYKMPAFLQEIDELLETSSGSTTLEKISSRRKAENIKKILSNFSEDKWEKYVTDVKPLLENYIALSDHKTYQTVFGQKDAETPVEEDFGERTAQRLEVIDKYLHVAKNFIEIDVICYPQFKIGCTDCGQVIEEMDVDEDQGSCYCPCGNWFDYTYSSETPHQDPDKIDSGGRGAYEDKTNFIRCINSFQGIQEREIPSSLISKLDDYFHKNCGIPSADKIRTLPPDEYGHRGKDTSIRLLEEGLKQTGNTQYYRDMNLIAHLLWGWILPDISHLVLTVLDDYARTQEIFREIHPVGSSINVHLRLFWHLRAVGYKCRLEDFKVPSSNSETLKRQSVWFKEMCERTGLLFTHII